MNTITAAVCVASGGAAGSACRYLLGVSMSGIAQRIPYSILAVNIVGCFLAGLIAAWLAQRGQSSAVWRLILITGFCGGFTTFSAFSLDTLKLLHSGEAGTALLNVLLNVVCSLLAVVAGFYLAQSLLEQV